MTADTLRSDRDEPPVSLTRCRIFRRNRTVEDILRLAFKESDEVAAAMDALTDEMTRKPDDASLLKRYAQLETRLEILGGYNRDYEINRVCNGLEIRAGNAFAEV